MKTTITGHSHGWVRQTSRFVWPYKSATNDLSSLRVSTQVEVLGSTGQLCCTLFGKDDRDLAFVPD